MFCEKCGIEYTANTKYCSKCGSGLKPRGIIEQGMTASQYSQQGGAGDPTAGLVIRNVRFLSGNSFAEPPPLESRVYAEAFPARTTKIIYFEIIIAPLGQTINTELIFTYYDDKGNPLEAENKVPVTIENDTDNLCSGWGYATENIWVPGRYTVEIRVGSSAAVKGTFTITGGAASHYSVPTTPSTTRSASGIRCPKCGTPDPVVQTILRGKSCLRHLIEIILILLPIVGWGILIFSIITDQRKVTAATCQKCGYLWDVNDPSRAIH